MKNKQLSIILVLAFILCLAVAGYFMVGFAGILFSVAFLGGFVLWLFSTYQTPINPHAIILPYLLTIIFFIIHVYEEYVYHIEITLGKLSGFEVSQNQFLIIAAFSAPIVWLLGAVMMLKRWDFGYFLSSTFLFGMMFAELSHFFSPFMEDGTFHYSAGMYTAILPVVSAWITFGALRSEIKKNRKGNGAIN
jgi:hypothetical protein